jgi:hypothetical protein
MTGSYFSVTVVVSRKNTYICRPNAQVVKLVDTPS